MLDIRLPNEHRARHQHGHKRDREVEQQEIPRPDMDVLLAENLAPQEARERRGERERERAKVRADGQRVDRAVARTRVDGPGRGPELEDAREEDRGADVRPTELLCMHVRSETESERGGG